MKCDYLKIKNWDKWQTYRKDRGQPPWIKIHRSLMRNIEWISLTDAERGQLVAIWLLAADHNGVIPASEEVIKKRVGQNALEMKIGLSWINKIGIILILIGVGVFIYWSYDKINDYVKGSFVFLLGTAFLILGEYFFRKKKEVFSQGLLGGGISILFA